MVAARLGRASSTISRELAGNGGRHRYRADRADRAALHLDEHGTMIYECDPPPTFIAISGQGLVVGKPGPALTDFLKNTDDGAVTARQETAFELYSASFFVSNADARFTLLMMAIETLIDQEQRSEEARDHIRGLIERTRDSALPAAEVQSLTSSLEWLFLESIGQAGRGLVQSLTSKKYKGIPAVRFFTDCYEIRSALVHGKTPRPLREDVDSMAASLEILVGDLIVSSMNS